MVNREVLIDIIDLYVYFGNKEIIKNLNIEIYKNEILGIIGPANSGKTTLLRTLNRMNELNPHFQKKGKITFKGKDIDKINPYWLRRKIGIIFALPQVLPISIYDNICYGPRLQGIKNKNQLDQIVEESLKKAYLWEEVKDRLFTPATKLSGGQQQRLCIARTLANNPEVILYDEPCSGLDPISTAKIEEAMRQLKHQYTQIIVTNNTKQAARISERCAFFLMGELIEINQTSILFTAPKDKRTDDYIRGRFG